MKQKSIFIFLFVILTNLFANDNYLNQKFHYISEYATVIISKDCIEFDTGKEKGQFLEFPKFDMFKGEKHNYIILNCTIEEDFMLTLLYKTGKKFYRYSEWEEQYSKVSNKLHSSAALQAFQTVKTSSYITETDKFNEEIEYTPHGSLFNRANNPWAVSETAKEKYIIIAPRKYRVEGFSYAPINYLVFLNGFVCADKDYLYERNSRARKIRISYNDVTFDIELQDIGNYQSIKLPSPIDPLLNTEIKIEILDSYKGSKYSDIVISGIYYLDAVLKD
ncbi:MAG: hypothetical protein J5631_03270 [Spirochaetaceae bacterium]|nr:hypothetical protein [Spirochaetaceae bacterium]